MKIRQHQCSMRVADEIDKAAIEIAKYHLGIRPAGVSNSHDHAMLLIGRVGHSLWAAREMLGLPPLDGLDEQHRTAISEAFVACDWLFSDRRSHAEGGAT